MNLGHLKLDYQNPIHIVGIGGIGMSGLAKLLHQDNIKVQGSDLSENFQVTELRKLGIKVFTNHNAENIWGCSLVVKSSAIKNDNVEIKEAKNKAITVISRAELLSNILLSGYNVCITGAHGKTSTTCLVYSMLKAANFDPTVICGGIINSINSNVFKGSDAINVVEADESDGTFMVLPTNISVITNVDNEHLDYYGSLQNIINVYKLFIDKSLLKDLVIVCDDCENLKVINKNYIHNSKYISYGIDSASSDLRAINLQTTSEGIKFDIALSEKCQKALSLQINKIKGLLIKNYGKHNVLNALAGIIVYLFKGGKIEALHNALQFNEGVQRRFSVIGKVNDITLIDDYAHHPNEIKATLSMAREHSSRSKGKVVAVFQPHRYSRFKELYQQFLSSFKQADFLIVLDIYSAGENPINNITSETFTEDIKSNIVAFYCKDKIEIKNKINELCSPGDYIIFMGAGNVSNIAKEIFNDLQQI
ncbi:UDP-N-acetylmuramate--L-alanine ligase [Candidatus Bandiella numerosa]|uniref:UDP-N-acetylmuramate--L-alanine ligase n=1 Tax=Candidatus Bandiella numerosa TaxID=2570586 RepID=UPI00249F82F7|nr:UDP-N-acetylmuramate--L-alanine ligase [Candidatus Bandiella numerosa]WHA05268.1 UDP-N-acetylmuramate--L-alanine ligase [Candidatus Bandiella numerosa]